MVSPAVLVAADIAGLSEIYKVGGAQAIAAMAYGTNSITKVKKIVGPGNVYVTTAKQLVTSEVAIDCPAGPSEVAILSDSAGNAKLIAADLLAQAEHDPRALIVFVTTSRELCRKVSEEIETQIASLRRATIIRSSLSCNGVAVLVRSLGEAVELVNELAPEHVQIMTRRPRDILPKIENAGAIFVGEYSPVALGDYSAGINHVLPTGGFARAYSGLGTTDFLRRISYLECSKKGLRLLAEHTVTLALTEGLDGHAKSVAIRSA